MSHISTRKKDHVDLTITDQTQYGISTGFDRYYFNHNALPEVNFDEISTQASLLGRSFSFPLMISSMTGGYSDAGPVNAIIAEFCEEHDLPFGVGSQRAMLVDETQIESFAVARKKAPNAFIAGNIGGAQLIGGLDKSELKLIIDTIQADAMIVHLNPLQEMMQPEGDRNFKGVLSGIEQLVKDASIPVIAKETGAGISSYTAKRLLNAGVQAIDVAGAGGTSWAKVENQREDNEIANFEFDDWGVPTTVCLQQISALQWERSFELIASGGIRSASDIAKSLCLGATFSATAQPIIKAIKKGGAKQLETYFEHLKHTFKTLMLLLGCSSIQEMNRSLLIEK
ncbi:MAG: type 2 isopentenyl-diphosphate Delta-isomerase [Balneolaceae bacterium]|nr:type 2 isopentenyl-diphosphate Delta-isomerase [Balneolaceae bacterium]